MAIRELLQPILDLAKPLIDTGCKLIESLLGEPCKVAGNLLADQVYVWQWKNRVRSFARAKAIIDERHIPERVLPPGFLLPLLEAAGNIEEPSLQELWAQLLASGIANDEHLHPSFSIVLSQISVRDAHLLTKLKSRWNDSQQKSGSRVCSVQQLSEELQMGLCETRRSVENLKRLGICEDAATPPYPKPTRGEPSVLVSLSYFGNSFADACLGDAVTASLEDA